MTPIQLDHLRAIDAHLKNLLEQAKKRTPGRWVAGSDTVWAKDEEDERVCNDCGGWDPDYIASCAGNAEAGWKSTLTAIARCNRMSQTITNAQNPTTAELALKHELHLLVCEILAAWPIENLP
jgi:hypothetical protein